MLRKIAGAGVFAAALAGAAGLWLTRPAPLPDGPVASLPGDAARGEAVFLAGGCASCHHAQDATGEAKLILTGGQRFASDFGTFLAPNISSDPQAGIGGWTQADFARALRAGVSPEGQHYYPAFPYTAYARMTDTDVADLWAYMQTLPAAQTPSQPHDLGFPFNIRRGLGLWKQRYLTDDWAVEMPQDLARGQYLAEALAHCAECHTPRDALGGLDRAAWMAGAPNPSGSGRIPGLTPAQLVWTAADIAYYLETGFTPDFDSVGGHMAAVVDNFSQLSAADRQAVAAYIKALPAR